MISGQLITALTSLLAGLVAGFVMHRSDFCMTGMFRDLYLFRSTFMLRILALLVAVAMVLLEMARLSGHVALFPFPGYGVPALTTVAGGALFGVGMVLAGGCVAGTLYKMGSGNLVSLCAFIGLLVGSAAFAEIYPYWMPLAAATKLQPGYETVAGIAGLSQSTVVAGAFALLAVPVVLWWRGGLLVRKSGSSGYLQPWCTAIVLALLVAISVVVIGVPLGITTSYAKIGAWIQQYFMPEHVQTLEYFKTLPFSYDNRLLNISYSGGPGPAADSIGLVQFPLLAGLVGGGLLSALLVKEFHIYWRVPVRQLLSGLAGGVLMGLAARMAPSCNLWHLLGGLPVLATQSLLFVFGLLPGTWLGCRMLTGLVLRQTH